MCRARISHPSDAPSQPVVRAGRRTEKSHSMFSSLRLFRVRFNTCRKAAYIYGYCRVARDFCIGEKKNNVHDKNAPCPIPIVDGWAYTECVCVCVAQCSRSTDTGRTSKAASIPYRIGLSNNLQSERHSISMILQKQDDFQSCRSVFHS